MDDEETEEIETSEVDEETDDGAPSLSQAQLNKLMTKEKRAGERAARKAIADELGVSIDEAKSILEAARKREADEADEVTRATSEAEQARQELASERKARQRAELRSQLQEALSVHTDAEGNAMPIRPERVKLALRLGLDTALGLEDGDPEERVEAAVESLFADSPEWFGSRGSGDDNDDDGILNGRTPTVRGRGPNDRKPKPKSAAARGAEAAKSFGGGFIPPIPTS